MYRPLVMHIDSTALLHNLNVIKKTAPNSKIIAVVKANAYGCGIKNIVPVLDQKVYAFGVTSIDEALAVRKLTTNTNCILLQGVYSQNELQLLSEHQFQMVIHNTTQLSWLINNPLANKVKIWLKINTGMNRLGLEINEIYAAIDALNSCSWVDNELGLLTHLACSYESTHPQNKLQFELFKQINSSNKQLVKSMANSAAILALPETHFDVIRPGVMLYGVSPFADKCGKDLGLKPVMQLKSKIIAINNCPAKSFVGYGASWQALCNSRIGVIAIGYGDGYPRHIGPNTPVYIGGQRISIVGKVSMDLLTVDLTGYPFVSVGDEVECWGANLPIETIAACAGTIPYELMCQFISREK